MLISALCNVDTTYVCRVDASDDFERGETMRARTDVYMRRLQRLCAESNLATSTRRYRVVSLLMTSMQDRPGRSKLLYSSLA